MRNAPDRVATGTRDQAAFEDFFRTHYRAVRGYVTGHYSGLDVDEVVASTFHVAWQRFDEIVADTARAWLIGVARNLIRNADRSRGGGRTSSTPSSRRGRRSASDWRGVGCRSRTSTSCSRRSGVSGRTSRRSCCWRRGKASTAAALGVVLGVPANTATVRLFRARQRLRRLIAEEADE